MIDTIKDENLKKHTGKTWKSWIEILNRAGAVNWPHKEIVAFLKKQYKQTTWWQQMIANGYEVATGKRIAGQSLKGTYSATLTKTLPHKASDVWKWCNSEIGIAVWLKPLAPVKIAIGQSFEIEGGIYGEVRTLRKGQRIRLRWLDSDFEKATTVQLHIYARGKDKCMLVIQHDGLPTARSKMNSRSYWADVIAQISAELSSSIKQQK